jgi:hypothetical protein
VKFLAEDETSMLARPFDLGFEESTKVSLFRVSIPCLGPNWVCVRTSSALASATGSSQSVYSAESRWRVHESGFRH